MNELFDDDFDFVTDWNDDELGTSAPIVPIDEKPKESKRKRSFVKIGAISDMSRKIRDYKSGNWESKNLSQAMNEAQFDEHGNRVQKKSVIEIKQDREKRNRHNMNTIKIWTIIAYGIVSDFVVFMICGSLIIKGINTFVA